MTFTISIEELRARVAERRRRKVAAGSEVIRIGIKKDPAAVADPEPREHAERPRVLPWRRREDR